jgi:hypothetical protein
MLPHEWIEPPSGARPMKVDAVDHGTGHLFPGLCDALWDLAGAIVEFRLEPGASLELMEAYFASRSAGQDARMRCYLVAYSAFRVGCMQMARMNAPPFERARIERALAGYTSQLAGAVFALQSREKPRRATAPHLHLLRGRHGHPRASALQALRREGKLS